MNNQLVIVALSAFLLACNNGPQVHDSGAEANATAKSSVEKAEKAEKAATPDLQNNPKVRALETIVKGNAEADARAAFASGNKQFWAYQTRGSRTVPGFSNKDSNSMDSTQYQLAPAMGDVVYGDKHLKLRLQFVEYAKQYNQTLKELLSH